MAYSGRGHDIIRENSAPWLILFVSILAIILIIVLMYGILSGRIRRAPDWAPSGCSIHRSTADGRRIIVNVHELENFDSEVEVAALLIAVIDNESDFFRERPNNIPNVLRDIEVRYPEGSPTDRPILQYQEIHYEDQRYNLLRIFIHQNVTGVYHYYTNEVDTDTFHEIVNGGESLGFLDWIAEVYPDHQPE